MAKAEIKIAAMVWRNGTVFARLEDGSEHEVIQEPLTAKQREARRAALEQAVPAITTRARALVDTTCTKDQRAALVEIATCTDDRRVAALTEKIGPDLHWHRWALGHALKAAAALAAGDDDEAAAQQEHADYCLLQLPVPTPESPRPALTPERLT